MAFNFKKNIVVGVSINPELGLEVAQIDVQTKTILKYTCKQLAYDNLRREVADMDILKETLQDAFIELDIPRGSEVVINIPATTAMETIIPNGRLIALQSGANVVMPNVSDICNRKKYEIYPNKAGINDNEFQIRQQLEERFASIGRTISKEKGFRKK